MPDDILNELRRIHRKPASWEYSVINRILYSPTKMANQVPMVSSNALYDLLVDRHGLELNSARSQISNLRSAGVLNLVERGVTALSLASMIQIQNHDEIREWRLPQTQDSVPSQPDRKIKATKRPPRTELMVEDLRRIRNSIGTSNLFALVKGHFIEGHPVIKIGLPGKNKESSEQNIRSTFQGIVRDGLIDYVLSECIMNAQAKNKAEAERILNELRLKCRA